ncbi:hypothetical protein R1sor_003104 [Riccia sorocarpa]|uniref:Protein N-terminal asparagine amidohydrolase n=1 Tax=Riccia sorocarpa TaxID=122646 RepID=A0ABD3H0M8_9MARC
MILVDGAPIVDGETEVAPMEVLSKLLQHATVVKAVEKFKEMETVTVKPPRPSGNNDDEEEEEPTAETQPANAKFIYVFQREYATVESKVVQFVGTDEVTTCIGLVIRNPATGLTSVGHFDSPDYAGKGLKQMITSHNLKEPSTLQVHLVGAYDDALDNGDAGYEGDEMDLYSAPLSLEIMDTLHKSKHKFEMGYLCILEHNSEVGPTGYARPVISGLVVDTESGAVMPARFERGARGPDSTVRKICSTTALSDPSWEPSLLSPYQTHTDSFIIKASKWGRRLVEFASYMLTLDDEDFLQKYSTSPYAEGPEFVDNCRRVFRYMVQFPDWEHTFPGWKSRVFVRTDEGGWIQQHSP